MHEAAIVQNISKFGTFLPKFEIFCPVLPIFWKITCMSLLSRIGPVYTRFWTKLSTFGYFYIWKFQAMTKWTNIEAIFQNVSNFDPCPPLKGEVSFDYLPRSPREGGGQIWEFLKRGWKYGAGAGLLKKAGEGRGWHFSYLCFSRFIIFTFRNYFTLYKIGLCIWRKIIFFCYHNFMKKGHSKLSTNEPENIP